MRIIKSEVLITKAIDIPRITGVFDPLSKKKDGTITPQAPVVVSGCNLNLKALGDSRFCLTSAIDYIRVIELSFVYKRSDEQVVILLPYLEPGEYFPAIVIQESSGENSIYILPVSWVVRPDV